jgi:porphobilinogen deaminase
VALEEGRAHLAVHSLKDVPMDLPEGFVLAAVLEREDPRDAFVSNRFNSVDELPQGAVVGTSSLRRVVQLKALRPDLRIEPLRGNLDTRLRKLDEGGYDAIVLAAAGLMRLGLADRIRSRFDANRMIPAAGQGALGIEVLASATMLRTQLGQMTHQPTWLAAHAERAVSRSLGGSCSMPLAAHARRQPGARRGAGPSRMSVPAACGAWAARRAGHGARQLKRLRALAAACSHACERTPDARAGHPAQPQTPMGRAVGGAQVQAATVPCSALARRRSRPWCWHGPDGGHR